MTNIADIPDAAWISKSFEREVHVGGGGHTFGEERAYPGRQRVVGTIQGEHPDLGRVRVVPSVDHDLRVTDVNAWVHEDGRLEPVDRI